MRDPLRANRRVAQYLDGAVALPDQLPESYAFGSEEEAVIAARTLAEAWSADGLTRRARYFGPNTSMATRPAFTAQGQPA